MMSELEFFLGFGFEIKQLRGEILINQAKYIQDMLLRFKMDDAKSAMTPMLTSSSLDLDPNGNTWIKRYCSMFGFLFYLCASRPDFMLSVGVCARCQSAPKGHLVAVKRIFWYLVHTSNFGLRHPKGSSFKLFGYSDLDWEGDKMDMMPTSWACQFNCRSLVCWYSKKQNYVSLSTSEAEYVAAASCCAQLWWMRQTLLDFGLACESVPLLCDNGGAIKIVHNPMQHSKTKHIEIRHHFF